jgi:hypothetical protein
VDRAQRCNELGSKQMMNKNVHLADKRKCHETGNNTPCQVVLVLQLSSRLLLIYALCKFPCNSNRRLLISLEMYVYTYKTLS